jgi:hypothetical protein
LNELGDRIVALPASGNSPIADSSKRKRPDLSFGDVVAIE